MQSTAKHKPNLDLLRAIAILLVIVFHISQYVTTLKPIWHSILSLGSYGVDIFFVLSGWLIGGIFFREYQSSGDINFGRFWSRRWLRTLPPYYVALLVSWYAVHISRGEPFDIGYIFFLQNYYETLPFFKISWSLCVEEHFYLLLPPVFYLSLKYDIVILTCIFLILTSLVCRVSFFVEQYPGFSFMTTATHLRLDGLSLGVLSAYIHNARFQWWKIFSVTMKYLGFISGALGSILFISHSSLMYSVGIFSFSLFFCAALCICIDSPDWKISMFPLVSMIALSSYSLYLTHALVINSMERFFQYQGFVFFLVTFTSVLLIGYVFRLLVEKPSIKVREVFSP